MSGVRQYEHAQLTYKNRNNNNSLKNKNNKKKTHTHKETKQNNNKNLNELNIPKHTYLRPRTPVPYTSLKF